MMRKFKDNTVYEYGEFGFGEHSAIDFNWIIIGAGNKDRMNDTSLKLATVDNLWIKIYIINVTCKN